MMPSSSTSLRRFSLLFTLAALAAVPRAARAQAPEDVLVVDVDASAAALDAAKLREAVGQELHATAIAPDDARAPSAKGTLKIEASEAKHAMRITYVARATPTVRSVPLPAEPEAARREAVLVAGNLARDEGAELARELRKKKQLEDASHAPVEATTPRAAHSERTARDMLEELDKQQRSLMNATLWGALGASAVGAGVGTAVYVNGDSRTGGSLLLFSGVLAADVGFNFLLAPASPYKELIDRSALNSFDLEAEWARAADDERASRRTRALASFVAAGLSAGVGTWALLAEKTWGANRTTYGAVFLAFGGILGVGGVYFATNDGPLEGALHVYEKATGFKPAAPAAPVANAAPRLQLAPVPGGAMAGLSGIF